MTTNDRIQTPPDLTEAFRHFSEASEKLQSKYDLLLRQSEDLRSELKLKDEEIKRTERLATLGETAAAIAHEVRNPLGAMKMFVSLLKQDLSNQPGPITLINEINKSIAAIDAVVVNILQFAKGRELNLSPLNLHALIQEQVLLSRQSKGIAIELKLAANPFITANEQALRQVLINLLDNAEQALRGQGNVKISTRDIANDSLELCIHDDGAGVRSDIIGRIFEPFVTTKCDGTGLGLAVVRQIVEAHHGSINVNNNQGAQFTLILPRRS